MKYILLSFFIAATCFAKNKNSENIAIDENGFVTCYQVQDKTYFFDWDHFIRTPTRNVRYFESSEYLRVTSHKLRSCKDQKFIIDQIPSEILMDLSEIQNVLPSEVLFSLQQISEGAHTFRTEKTAADYIQNRKQIFQADHPEVLTNLRKEVGDQFASDVIAEFIKNIVVKNKSCESLIGTCDFYLCQEQKNPCGLDGYNLSFGYKYCSGSKFKLINEMKTEFGKSWVTEVFQCLQKKNILIETKSCEEFRKESYSSHPDCYVQAGFCRLKGVEKVHVFSLIKKEILSFQTVVQGVDILKQCGDEK